LTLASGIGVALREGMMEKLLVVGIITETDLLRAFVKAA